MLPVRRPKVNVVRRGWCDCCVAEDLLFARRVDADSLFLICAACAMAGPLAGDDFQDIRDVHTSIAPSGWRLALATEVPDAESAGTILDNSTFDSYEQIIGWYPGFIPNGPVADPFSTGL